MQWQTARPSGSPSIRYRTLPHWHPPSIFTLLVRLSPHDNGRRRYTCGGRQLSAVPSGGAMTRSISSVQLVELADRIRSQADTRLILGECPSHTAPNDAVSLWVFRERAEHRLEQLWAGELSRPEIDELADVLRRENSVCLGGIDSRHAPPSKRFRLLWTLPPAPCRIYTRRGLASEVEPAIVTRHGLRRRQQHAVRSVSHVEGWIGPDWTHAGITLKGRAGEEWEVIRLRNEGLFMQFLIMYDGIDLMMDTSWLDRIVPRVAEVFGVAWHFVDHTVTPPEIVRQSEPPAVPAAGDV